MNVQFLCVCAFTSPKLPNEFQTSRSPIVMGSLFFAGDFSGLSQQLFLELYILLGQGFVINWPDILYSTYMYSELNKSIRDCTLAQRGTIEDDQKAIVMYNVEMSQWPHFNCCIRYDEKIICRISSMNHIIHGMQQPND